MNEYWSSRLMFILAAIGSAVGLGNIWRFSYMAGEYGGGSFIILYILSVFLIGLPIMVLEFTAGRHFAAPLSRVFEKIGKKFHYASIIPHALNFIVLSYYVVVTSWTLAYLFSSLTGFYKPLGEFSQMPMFVIFAPLTLIAIYLITRSNLREGIEKTNKVLMPLFFAILAFLVANSLSLPGLEDAIFFYTYFGNVTIETMVAAVTQALFSLSVGAGIMLTYASYLRKKENIASSAAIVSFMDTMVALFAGIALFPIVFTYGLNPAGGAALAFDTLPLAFMQMPFGNLLMPLFFLLLFSVAITSAISMAEMIVADISARIGRKKAAFCVAAFVALAALPSWLSYSFLNLKIAEMPVLDYLDGTIVVTAAPAVALIMVLVLGWGWKNFEGESVKVIPGILLKPYIILIKFVIPLVLLALSLVKILS